MSPSNICSKFKNICSLYKINKLLVKFSLHLHKTYVLYIFNKFFVKFLLHLYKFVFFCFFFEHMFVPHCIINQLRFYIPNAAAIFLNQLRLIIIFVMQLRFSLLVVLKAWTNRLRNTIFKQMFDLQ